MKFYPFRKPLFTFDLNNSVGFFFKQHERHIPRERYL